MRYRKRLERLEQALEQRQLVRTNFPPILPVDEWEALAMPMQEKLAAEDSAHSQRSPFSYTNVE